MEFLENYAAPTALGIAMLGLVLAICYCFGLLKEKVEDKWDVELGEITAFLFIIGVIVMLGYLVGAAALGKFS